VFFAWLLLFLWGKRISILGIIGENTARKPAFQATENSG
jgi:hypothetical protein